MDFWVKMYQHAENAFPCALCKT